MTNSFSILLLLTSIISLTACKKDPEVEEKDDKPEMICDYTDDFIPEPAGPIADYGLIPINLVNYWVYADTTWINDSTYSITGIDTVRANNPKRTDNDVADLWFMIDGDWPIESIHQADDRVYSLEMGYNGCIYKANQFFEAGIDTTESQLWVDDYGVIRKEYKSGSVISTPAGDFSDCSVFEHVYDEGYQILKPGIGFVKFARQGYETSYTVYTLVDYYIE